MKRVFSFSRFKPTLLGLMLVISLNAAGQTYIGLSANLGNRFSFSPESTGLKRPVTLSGNLLVMHQDNFKNSWIFQQTLGLGVMGTNLKIVSIDSILTDELFTFLDYSTFYMQYDLMFGKKITLGKRKLILGAGGGITMYYCSYTSSSYSFGTVYNSAPANLFDAEIICQEISFAGFVKLSAQFTLNHLFSLGLAYAHHFTPVITGSYEFYHTPEPAAGEISLTQRELKLSVYYRILKK